MRYTYDGEYAEFAGTFIEFTPTGWSRKQRRALMDGNDEEWCAALRRTVHSIHVPLTEGGAIDTPDAITPENIAAVDDILVGWFSGTVIAALQDAVSLGNAERRRLLATLVEKNLTKTTPAAEDNQTALPTPGS